MKILNSPSEMISWRRGVASPTATVGLVPTMGALHRGHSSLITRAVDECDLVVTSIFVNSLQFNRSDDYEAYPRTFEDDIHMCRSAGVNVVYAPSSSAMYPSGFDTKVAPGIVSMPLEGEGRPGHFEGVATVVSKLLNAVQPTRAYFGRKDFQQVAVIRKLVDDLDFGVDVVEVDTVRDADGLALSSRNSRLSETDRAAAGIIYQALVEGMLLHESGEHDAKAVTARVSAFLAREPRARPEYVAVVDQRTCAPLVSTRHGGTIAVAVWFGDVRLIDNVPLAVDV